MKLNNDIRDRLKVVLTEKAFPKTTETELYDALRKECEKYGFFQERKSILKKFPDYIRQSSKVSFKKKYKNARRGYYDTREVEVSLSYPFATQVLEYGNITFSLDEEEGLKRANPDLWEKALAVFEFEDKKREYKDRLENILSVNQSSTPLIKILPECEEFFKMESHGVTSSTSLVNKADVDFVRSYLSKEVNG